MSSMSIKKKKINGTEMNYFPFIDFVALQSHIHSVTFYTFWGSSWGVPSTWRAPQRHKGPRTSPQTRLQWLTRQVGMLAKSPPLCPCERETQTLNHWLLPQLWLRCCCCYVSLSPPKPSLCMSFPTPRLSVALGGSGWLWMAL